MVRILEGQGKWTEVGVSLDDVSRTWSQSVSSVSHGRVQGVSRERGVEAGTE